MAAYFEDPYTAGKVLILYGLRRTGKTILIFQSICDRNFKNFVKTVYIRCSKRHTTLELIQDLRFLVKQGFYYIYIDEITLLEDFIPLSSTISDIYGAQAKVVLSGTDSLSFSLAGHHELYDRYKMIHTTYISFKEFATVLGIRSIDAYIEYGGTMEKEGVNYNRVTSFNDGSINEYVDTSIIHNIIHSLRLFQDGNYFFHLRDLYDKHELENVINRIVEDQNHRFAIDVIESTFISHDYGSLKQLLSSGSNYEKFGNILAEVDEKRLIEDLMQALSTLNKEKQTQVIDDVTLIEVKEYLKELDVIKEVEEIVAPTYTSRKRVLFTQPGLRFAQAKCLVDILFRDESLKKYDQHLLDALKDKLCSDVKGKMMEDIVLLEALNANKHAFKFFLLPRGEYDLALLDKEHYVGEVYEVKYSKVRDIRQAHYLLKEEIKEAFEAKYYPIHRMGVIYRGDAALEGDIQYYNIEEYLMGLE